MGTGLDSIKTASKKTVFKAGGFVGNKNPDASTKSNHVKIVKPDETPKNVVEIIIPQEKRDEILDKLRKALKKWNTIKY